MSASNLDKFLKGARKLAGTIDSSGVIDGLVDNFGLSSGSGIPTDTGVEITIDRVDANGTKTPDKEETIVGVVDGDRIVDAVRGVEGTAQAHASGAVWEMRLTADQWERMIDGILAEHGQDGKHVAVQPEITNIPLNAPRGFLINGKIVASVASNNLIVAIKGLDGNNPSATNPVYCRIGDTVRSITAALSITAQAGYSWCNAGSAELATKEIDYFVYLGWKSSDSTVALCFARIPNGCVYEDFSGTPTDEKYLRGIVNLEAGSEVENVGRFAATLSAGAGYTWTVPTFTSVNLIQRPIYETRWLLYVPQWTCGGSMTIGTLTTNIGRYKISGTKVNLRIKVIGTTGGSADNDILATYPITTANNTVDFACSAWDTGILGGVGMFGSSVLDMRRYDSANFGIGAGRGVAASIFYEI